MKKRSRLTKKETNSIVLAPTPKSEEKLRGKKSKPLRTHKASSESSLLLYKQLNKVVDVINCDFNTRAEGPDLIRSKPKRNSIRKMSDLDEIRNMRQQIALQEGDREAIQRDLHVMRNKHSLIEKCFELNQVTPSNENIKRKEMEELGVKISKKEDDQRRVELRILTSKAELHRKELAYVKNDIAQIEKRMKTEDTLELKRKHKEQTHKREDLIDKIQELDDAVKKMEETRPKQRQSIDEMIRRVERERLKLDEVKKKREGDPSTSMKRADVAKLNDTVEELEDLIKEGYLTPTDIDLKKVETQVQKKKRHLEQDLSKEDEELRRLSTEINPLNELLRTDNEPMLRDWNKRKGPPGSSPVVAYAMNDDVTDSRSKQRFDADSGFPIYDTSVIRELKEADARAAKAAKAIEAVREQLSQYANKDEMTDDDIEMMAQKQKELMDKMEEFEEITKRVQHLVGLVDATQAEASKQRSGRLDDKTSTSGFHPEDALPKVIICGTGGIDEVPKIIICEQKDGHGGKKSQYDDEGSDPYGTNQSSRGDYDQKKCPPCKDGKPKHGKKGHGADAKDKGKECSEMQSKLDSLTKELESMREENKQLKSTSKSPGMKNAPTANDNMPKCKVEAYRSLGLPIPPAKVDNKNHCPGAKYAASRGWNENQGCRAELNRSLKTPSAAGDQSNAQGCHAGCRGATDGNKKSDMDSVVKTMEQEVKSLQKELELVQAERRGLAMQKKLLNCMNDAPGGGGVGGPSGSTDKTEKVACYPTNKPLVLMKNTLPESASGADQQLNSLREQYRKLQEDYNAKVEEVSLVKVEYESAKKDAHGLLEKCREAEARVDDLLERLKAIETDKSKVTGSKDQMFELEQQLTLAKQRYREGQEELEEVKTTMQDQMMQLEEYRTKYMNAQQTVEEQRRQIDIMELENNRISEQVNLEINRVKTQFQEKLQELTPLPDMLKATQMKLQECDQLRQLAERNVEQLLNQADEIKDQKQKLEQELDELKKNSASHSAEKSNLTNSLTSGEKKIEETKSENAKLRTSVARLEEVALANDRKLDEKNHEILQLQTQLETLREESARQVSRTKDRCEAVRRTLQNQISQLEFQLAQSRAAARTAQKDRDEIRQKMQAQITSLNENFEQAQLRIRSLQSHVNYLKNSYTNIFAPEQSTPMGPKPIDGVGT